MSRIATAKQFWSNNGTTTTFEQDLAFHTVHNDCLVYALQDNFIMARPVSSKDEAGWETYKLYPENECDAWFVWYGGGKAQELKKLFSSGLLKEYKYLIRNKNNKIRIITMNKFLNMEVHNG